MRVFVLNTGRCGSYTFARACEHMTNFTCAHEGRTHLLGEARFAYPDNHIEIDNRLAWLLGRLDQAHGDKAYYVHLTRDPAKVKASWARRFTVLSGIAPAYRDSILTDAARRTGITRQQAAADLVDTVTANIELFLKDKTNVMRIELERVEDFGRFWDWIGAEGSRDDAIAEWTRVHDTEVYRTPLKARVRDTFHRVARAVFPPR